MAEDRPEQPHEPAGEAVLLFIIVSDPGALDRLITLLLDVGITGATVIESRGMGAIIREEMPIFSGLAALLPSRTGSRMIVSVTGRQRAADVLSALEREFKERDRPMAFTTPIAQSLGIRL
jgi:hypothetical protein